MAYEALWLYALHMHPTHLSLQDSAILNPEQFAVHALFYPCVERPSAPTYAPIGEARVLPRCP
jgi:hypothetical protein